MFSWRVGVCILNCKKCNSKFRASLFSRAFSLIGPLFLLFFLTACVVGWAKYPDSHQVGGLDPVVKLYERLDVAEQDLRLLATRASGNLLQYRAELPLAVELADFKARIPDELSLAFVGKFWRSDNCLRFDFAASKQALLEGQLKSIVVRSDINRIMRYDNLSEPTGDARLVFWENCDPQFLGMYTNRSVLGPLESSWRVKLMGQTSIKDFLLRPEAAVIAWEDATKTPDEIMVEVPLENGGNFKFRISPNRGYAIRRYSGQSVLGDSLSVHGRFEVQLHGELNLPVRVLEVIDHISDGKSTGGYTVFTEFQWDVSEDDSSSIVGKCEERDYLRFGKHINVFRGDPNDNEEFIATLHYTPTVGVEKEEIASRSRFVLLLLAFPALLIASGAVYAVLRKMLSRKNS
jgi:hypothetical protein